MECGDVWLCRARGGKAASRVCSRLQVREGGAMELTQAEGSEVGQN